MGTRLLAWLDGVVFYGYALFLAFAGGVAGVLMPRWRPLTFEVFGNHVFRQQLDSEVMATVLNQYRFMKSFEFGFGLFALVFRKEIYTRRRFNRFFLGVHFLGTVGRVLSLLADGRPHVAYRWFPLLEGAIGAVVWLQTRRTVVD